MNLYLIEQDVNGGYDTYDSAVVTAECIEDARNTHPNGKHWVDGKWFDPDTMYPGHNWKDWVNPKQVIVTMLGVANDNWKAGVIVASFNAG